jgi:hypothetical protein
MWDVQVTYTDQSAHLNDVQGYYYPGVVFYWTLNYSIMSG